MSRFVRLASMGMVLAAVLAACAAAWAQPGPGGPGGPGGRGPGGFFGGMGVMSPYTLLNSDAVAKELNLVDDQKTKIKEINDKARASTQEMFSGLRDLSQEDRAKRMAEVGEKMQAQRKETEKAIEGVLLEQQLKRLKEIYLQFAGEQALRNPEVQASLGLSDDQKAKIRSPLEVLTADQKAAFEKMKGEKFDTSSIRLGGPGGPGGGRRGNRGGGPPAKN